MKPYHETEHGVLYHGDCLDILPTLADKSVDLVLTDPPYGIGYDYESYDDSRENTVMLIENMIAQAKRIAVRTAMFIDVGSMFDMPKPDWTLCWFSPSRPNRSPFGFSTWTPILFYGKDKRINGGQAPDGFMITSLTRAPKSIHTCPKPLEPVNWLLHRYTDELNTVVDPFGGTGTTAISCIKYNRKYILIEKEEKYCEIIAKMINTELEQTTLFDLL
jgi:site-specific DNA-methyltransferase (adenine-specific)